MVKDLNPLTTPDTVLTDVLNGTIITYNGNEFVLQNDMGNAKVERAKLSPGFVPLGVKEYGDIIYIASYNPETDECEIGSFPSPERDITGNNTIEGQTGITNGLFKNTDFKVPTTVVNGAFIPDEVISKIQKLNEQEVLKLNPGDKFIMTYQLGTGTITSANFGTYISNSEINKKTFSLNFFRIDETNTLMPLNEKSIKYIPHRPDIEEDEYAYFVESSGGSIAVELKLNNLTYHRANVREISKRKDPVKSIRVESVADSDSDVDFKGSRVDVTATLGATVDKKSFHLDTSNNSDKVSATVTGLEENQEVVCTVTPYHQYGYAPEFAQTFTLTIGKNLNATDYNNVFKWYVNYTNNRLELEFDSQIETENETKMYVEFYDPWSNISTIKTVSNPSTYGTMIMVMNLVNEPRTEVFNPWDGSNTTAKQLGGVVFSKLKENTSQIVNPILINPAKTANKKLIRSDEALRKDHFYIVRVCVYDEHYNEVTKQTEITYSHFYKALYTSDIYNELYDAQRVVGSGSTEYIPDFNTVPYPLEKLENSYTRLRKDPGVLVETKLPESPTSIPHPTAGSEKLYSLNTTGQTVPPEITLSQDISRRDSYLFNINSKANYKYGRIKTGIITTTGTNNLTVDSSKIEHQNPYEFELPITGTTGTISREITENTLRINVDGKTNRKGTANTESRNIDGAPQKTYLDKLQYRNSVTTTYTNPENFKYNTALVVSRTSLSYEKERDWFRADGWWINATTRNQGGLRLILRKPFENGFSGAPQTYEFQPNHTADKNTSSSTGFPRARSFVNSLTNLNNTVPTAPGEAGTTINDYGNYQFFSLGTDKYVDLYNDNLQQIHNKGSNSAHLLFVSRAANNQIVVIPVNAGIQTVNVYIRNLLKSLYILKKSVTPIPGYHINTSTIKYHDSSTSTTFKDLSYDVTVDWIAPVAKTYILQSIFKATGDTYVDFSTAAVNTIITQAIARQTAGQENLNNSIADNGFIPFIAPGNVPSDKVINLTLDDFVLQKGIQPAQIALFETSENDFERDLAILKNENNIDNTSIFYDPFAYTNPTDNALYGRAAQKLQMLFRFNVQFNEIEYSGLLSGGITAMTMADGDNRGLLGAFAADSSSPI